MGSVSFTEFFFLLVTGRRPTHTEVRFLDLLLVAIAEHGLTPTAQAARFTLAADPASLHGAVAAGILGCGPVILGTTEECGILLEAILAAAGADADIETAARSAVVTTKERGGRLPGFGHPVHKPLDPRAERIFSLARADGVYGRHCDAADRLRPIVAEIWGKPLTLNVSMAIAAVLLDLEFPRHITKSIPILARTAGLLAHLAEEKVNPIGLRMAAAAEAAVVHPDKADAHV
jgi:citrate synthase